jgi:UDP-N-acetylmuramate: L-alanyl-gamma-D-glutamyl-meso-diaminopimelate ligase
VWTPVQWFNETQGWSAGEPEADGRFGVYNAAECFGSVKLVLPGAHNRMNAVAAVAAAQHAGVAPAVALNALSAFRGVKRRMEVRGVARGVTVYDDFAHHPTAIAATIDALRQEVGTASIHAVLEPRSNTMKLGIMKAKLATSLTAADRVYCYAANLGWDAAAALAPLGDKSMVCSDIDLIVASVASHARPGDHVLVMSNGGFAGIHGKLLSALDGTPGAE